MARRLHLLSRPGRAGWGSLAVGMAVGMVVGMAVDMAVDMVEALAPRCGGELVAAALGQHAGGSEWLELTLARGAARPVWPFPPRNWMC